MHKIINIYNADILKSNGIQLKKEHHTECDTMSTTKLYLYIDRDSHVTPTEQAINRMEIKRNQIVYKNSIKMYDELIELVAEIVKKIGLPNNSISYSRVISRLIDEGYLSKNLEFIKTYELKKFFDVNGFLGFDIINGYGCCRHAASIHHDIFKSLKLSSEMLPCCYLDTSEIYTALRNDANHAVNLILCDGCYYVYDTLNKKFFRFIDGFTMENCLDNKEILFYKPSMDTALNDFEESEIIKRINSFILDSAKPHISSCELKEILTETDVQYNKNKNMLDELTEETKKYTKKICESVNSSKLK